MTAPGMSVLVPTSARPSLLRHMLESVARAGVPSGGVEVIVVDNSRGREAEAVVDDLRADVPSLSYVPEPSPGLHSARHTGLRAARGDLLVFADDDIRVAGTWLLAIARAFEDPAVGLVGGPCRPAYAVTPPAWVDDLRFAVPGGWFVAEFSLLDLGDADLDTSPELVFGCNFAVRKSLVTELGGFHPDALPSHLLRWRGDGETALAQAIGDAGWRVRYAAAAAVDHFVSAERMTTSYVVKRSFAEGVSMSFALARTGARPLGARACRRVIGDVSRVARVVMAGGSSVHRTREASMARGFAWHQVALARDPELRAWARRPDFFDAVVPRQASELES